MQSDERTEPTTVLYLPLEQFSHNDGTFAYFPATHEMHFTTPLWASAIVPSSVIVLPLTHKLHEVKDPGELLYFPAGQIEQNSALGRVE